MMETNTPRSQTTKSHENLCDDAIIESRVSGQLNSCGYPELARLAICVADRTVTLEGRVCSYHLKQLAQVLVMSMDEVVTVRNVIKVVK